MVPVVWGMQLILARIDDALPIMWVLDDGNCAIGGDGGYLMHWHTPSHCVCHKCCQ
jgi:hypothetical protein